MVLHAQATGHDLERFVRQGFPPQSPQCPVCAKEFAKSDAAADHARAVHGVGSGGSVKGSRSEQKASGISLETS